LTGWAASVISPVGFAIHPTCAQFPKIATGQSAHLQSQMPRP
jgi:hypothetical protein